MVDAADLKSAGGMTPCRFESGLRHHTLLGLGGRPSPWDDDCPKLHKAGGRRGFAVYQRPGPWFSSQFADTGMPAETESSLCLP